MLLYEAVLYELFVNCYREAKLTREWTITGRIIAIFLKVLLDVDRRLEIDL